METECCPPLWKHKHSRQPVNPQPSIWSPPKKQSERKLNLKGKYSLLLTGPYWRPICKNYWFQFQFPLLAEVFQNICPWSQPASRIRCVRVCACVCVYTGPFNLFDVPPICLVGFHSIPYRATLSRSRKRTVFWLFTEWRETDGWEVCLNFDLRLKISYPFPFAIPPFPCLFFHLSCLNDVNGSRAIELFIDHPYTQVPLPSPTASHGSELPHINHPKSRACMNRGGEHLWTDGCAGFVTCTRCATPVFSVRHMCA